MLLLFSFKMHILVFMSLYYVYGNFYCIFFFLMFLFSRPLCSLLISCLISYPVISIINLLFVVTVDTVTFCAVCILFPFVVTEHFVMFALLAYLLDFSVNMHDFMFFSHF